MPNTLRRRATAWLAALVILPLGFVAPASLAQVEESARLGATAWDEILREKRVSNNATMNRMVERVSNRILNAADQDRDQWEFAVIVDDTPNAFALPGGKIGVHTGLFDVIDNEAQLAAVVAHEIAHLTQGHPRQRMQRQGLAELGLGILGAVFDIDPNVARLVAGAATLGVILPHTRDQESQADEVGLYYMARAGYDPREAAEVWENFERMGGGGPEFLQTHPNPGNRMARLEELLPEVMPIYREHANITDGDRDRARQLDGNRGRDLYEIKR